MLQCAVRRVMHSLPVLPKRIILSGSDEFLARRVLLRERFREEQFLALSKHFGPGLSAAACAHAVCVLALEEIEKAP
jgi:hypothetical protein